MKNYYFKEVLFGLRKYYLEHQKQLNILKQYVTLDDEMVNDYYFWVSQGVLLFDREINGVKLTEYLKKHKEILNFNTESICNKINEDYVVENSFYNSPTIIDKPKFNKQAKLILESNFVKGNIKNNVIDNSIKMFTSTEQISIDLPIGISAYYFAYNDSLHISSLEINPRFIEILMNSEIKSDCLNDYQNQILKQTKEINLEIPKSINNKSNEFLIEEENLKVYLIKR